MSLLDEFGQEYLIMEKTRTPDGEGGFTVAWTEGASITMAQRLDTATEIERANAQGLKSAFTFLAPKTASIEYHDVFKRVSDGTIYRVTSKSGDSFTPASSSLNLTSFTCEEWTLT